MFKLQQLGFEKQWVYEIVLSSYGNYIPHAAPFGVKSFDSNSLSLDMYKGSNTLENILVKGEFVINMVDDPTFFYDALYVGKKINFGPGKKVAAPVILDSPSSLEMKVISTTDKKARVFIEAEVVYVHNPGKGKLINRAKSLFLESLIQSTRLSVFPKLELDKSMKENYRVIKKVAPGSKYETMMASLLKECGC
jgi:hypothetical protein